MHFMCAAWLVLAHYNISHAKVSESAKARSSKHDEQRDHHFTTSATHYYESMHAHISLASLPFCCLCAARSCVVATGYLPCDATCPTDTVSMSVRSVSQPPVGWVLGNSSSLCVYVLLSNVCCASVFIPTDIIRIVVYLITARMRSTVSLLCLCLLILLLFSDMPAYEECLRASRSCVCG